MRCGAYSFNKEQGESPVVLLLQPGREAMEHAEKVLVAFQTVVEHLLEDDEATLVPFLEELGLKHQALNVTAGHYEAFQHAFLESLQVALFFDFTEDVQQAWTLFLAALQEMLLTGETSMLLLGENHLPRKSLAKIARYVSIVDFDRMPSTRRTQEPMRAAGAS
eukprot:TRINITY_DN25426_c0_g1_i4.p2 TRINITY_DN25426_c0_g1~~TRINITY_DN25426_c0_g1_i4.p2  ORF type:complete len:164 (+),score=44.44 TRINITY_DN25426_c0_g1_i4:112-603(+)